MSNSKARPTGSTKSLLAGLSVLAWLLAGPASAEDCGTSEPCQVAEGSYHVALPEAASGPIPVILHFHGYGGTSAAAIKNRALVEGANRRGYLFVALNGSPPPGSSQRNNWSVRDGREPWRDEAAFARAVLDDLAKRHPIDRRRVLMTGFSRGASMVWDIACHDPDGFAAFAPISGAFWRPLPESCSGPVKLLHVHGWTDNVVPIEGRRIPGRTIRQGDAFASMAILRAAAGLDDDLPQSFALDGKISCRSWKEDSLRLCLHPGGHAPPKGWVTQAIDWFEQKVPTH